MSLFTPYFRRVSSLPRPTSLQKNHGFVRLQKRRGSEATSGRLIIFPRELPSSSSRRPELHVGEVRAPVSKFG